MKDFAKSIRTNNSIVCNGSNTREEAKTKDEYFKILKFYQIQGYKTKAGEYNPNGRIKLHKGDDSVEIVLVGNSKVGNAQKLYSDANVEIYDDGIVKLTQFPGYTQWAKDVDSIIRDEIRSLEKQISDLKNAAIKVKEVGKKYGLL